MADVILLAEHAEGTVRKATLELLTLARRLGEPAVLVCGATDEAVVKMLGEHGATSVHVAEGPDFEGYLVAPKAEALVALVRQLSPAAVLVTAGREGTEVAARAAVRLDSGIITNAIDVAAGDSGPLVFQSVAAGSWTTTSEVVRGTPFVTVRPNAVTPEAVGGEASLTTLDVDAGATNSWSRVVDRTGKTSAGRPDLADAAVVVAGGRGMGSAEAFGPLEELADVLGGAVAASRAATDLGWYDHDFQIGQTGKTVAPQLYLAAGISGAIQHRAGMQGSRTVVAINKDPKAPIFQISDLGVVGDAHTVVPALTAELRHRRT
jgi:electron transfer flavoprotein alpha subunit